MNDYNDLFFPVYKESQTVAPSNFENNWWDLYQPYQPYQPYPETTGTIDFKWWYPPEPIEPSGAKYERKDLPVIELQLKDQCGYTVITKVEKLASGGDGLLRIYYKEGRQKKTMMIPENSILAIHKTGWE